MSSRLLAAALSIALFGGRGVVAPVDELAQYDDTFDAGSSVTTDRGWSLHNGSMYATNTVTSGYYQVGVTAGGTGQAFWLNASQGPLTYRTIAGDVDCRARIRVTNAAGSGLPPLSSYRLAGIACHDPNRATVLNYLHFTAGVFNGAYSVETKNTVNSVSTFPATSVTPGATFDIDIRVVRVGQVFTTYYRMGHSGNLLDNTGWTQHQQFTRTGFPSTAQWGPMAYSNVAGADIGCRYLEIRFRRPS